MAVSPGKPECLPGWKLCQNRKLSGPMVRVKICGITNREDALQAVAAGADALGFVFYDKSPRCVTPETAAEIIAGLPALVSCVGLFVNAGRERIEQVVAATGLDVVQLHGDESPQECDFGQRRCYKALRLDDEADLGLADGYSQATLLVDAFVPGEYGGTGKVGNWELAARLAAERPVILAGGLNADNVSVAVTEVMPYGVDVSSGVEASPGRKDPVLVEAFIRAAKGF